MDFYSQHLSATSFFGMEWNYVLGLSPSLLGGRTKVGFPKPCPLVRATQQLILDFVQRESGYIPKYGMKNTW